MVLIEINTSPALFRAGKWLTDLLPRVVEEVAQVCVDPYFPPPAGSGLELPPRTDLFLEMDLVQYDTGGGGGAAAGRAGRAGGAALGRSVSSTAAGAARAAVDRRSSVTGGSRVVRSVSSKEPAQGEAGKVWK